MTCTKCGSPLDQGAAFCGNCGQPVMAGTVAAPNAAAPGQPAMAVQPVTAGTAPMAQPFQAPTVAAMAAQTQGSAGKATASMVLGICSLITWIIPIIGIPVSVTGLVFGVNNRHSTRRGQAIAGIVLACISFPLIVLSMIIGVETAQKNAAQHSSGMVNVLLMPLK